MMEKGILLLLYQVFVAYLKITYSQQEKRYVKLKPDDENHHRYLMRILLLENHQDTTPKKY